MHSSNRFFLPLCLLLFFGGTGLSPCWGQGAITALFPRTNEITGWTLSAPPKLFSNNQLFDYMDGAAEIPKSYAFRQLGTAKYQSSPSLVFEVAIFDMTRPEDAFGYYSARTFLEQTPSSRERVVQLDHPARLYGAVGVLTFWKDHYTVILQPDIGRPDDATLIKFAKVISAKIKAKGSPPALLKRLPAVSQLQNSARFIQGKSAFDATVMFLPKDVFGVAARPEVAAAEYTLSGKKTTIFIIKYPSAQAATSALSNYRQNLVSRKATVASGSTPQRFAAMAQKEKGTGAIVSGSYLGVVVNAKDVSLVNSALKQLRASMNAK